MPYPFFCWELPRSSAWISAQATVLQQLNGEYPTKFGDRVFCLLLLHAQLQILFILFVPLRRSNSLFFLMKVRDGLEKAVNGKTVVRLFRKILCSLFCIVRPWTNRTGELASPLGHRCALWDSTRWQGNNVNSMCKSFSYNQSLKSFVILQQKSESIEFMGLFR